MLNHSRCAESSASQTTNASADACAAQPVISVN
jgi:hypothetical protein